MIDEKIPRELRDRVTLLAEDHHVLWIVGWRISEYYKVTEDTDYVLEVQADGGEKMADKIRVLLGEEEVNKKNQ